jgi:hypothetical protein
LNTPTHQKPNQSKSIYTTNPNQINHYSHSTASGVTAGAVLGETHGSMGRLFDGGRSLGAIQQALANQAQQLFSLSPTPSFPTVPCSILEHTALLKPKQNQTEHLSKSTVESITGQCIEYTSPLCSGLSVFGCEFQVDHYW